MPGLLDLLGGNFGTDDPRQAAYLALASGLLSGRGNFGQVVGQSMMGAQQTLAAAREQQMKQQLMQAQMADVQAQARQRQQEADRLQSIMDLIPGIGKQAPSPTFAAGQQALSQGGGPTVQNAQTQNQIVASQPTQQDPMFGLDPTTAKLELLINKGANLPRMMLDMRKETLPQVDNQGNGFVRIPDPLAPGGYRFVSPSGAIQLKKDQAQAAADVASKNELVPGQVDSNGNPVNRTRAQILDAIGAIAPISSPYVGARNAPTDNGTAAIEQRRIMQAELDKEKDPSVRAAIQREIARLPQSSKAASGQFPAVPPIPGYSSVVDQGTAPGLTMEQAAKSASMKELATAAAQDAVKQINDYRDLQQSSTAAKRNIQSMREAIKAGTFTGGTADFMTRMLNYVAPALPQEVVNKIANSQVLDKNTIDLATQSFKQSFGSRPAAIEFTQLLKSIPSKNLQLPAMLNLLDQAEKKLNYAQATLPRALEHMKTNGDLMSFTPPGGEQTFATEKDVAAAASKGLVKKGDPVIINGRPAIWE